MCGIIGWIGDPDPELGCKLRDQISHRGPDSSGAWFDPHHQAWLGHRRLSILDLSERGQQPMASSSGRFMLVYNGEVYNFLPLRRELEQAGHTFRGHSDTEIVLQGFEQWGVQACLSRLAGMFALGVYDREERALWLARDPLGIKPLYYAVRSDKQAIAFGSELRTLRSIPWLDRTIDMDALHAYFRHLCVPSPASIWRGARKLRPGELLRWSSGSFSTEKYWNLPNVISEAKKKPFTGSFSAAVEELEQRLGTSVEEELVADVPVGAFLSGGIDSSTVVALAQKRASKPLHTFSIGFEEGSHDESVHARAVAAHLGTIHHEKILRPEGLLETIPHLADLHDEPFADSSSVPTHLLSRFTREFVKVALSGDGGDELFGGYPRFFWAKRIEAVHQLLPTSARVLLGTTLQRVPKQTWNILAKGPLRALAGAEGFGDRVHRLAGYLRDPPEEVYHKMLSTWQDTTALLTTPPQEMLGPKVLSYPGLSWSEQMMAADQENFLVDDALTKVDRSSMAVGLEVRVPILDHRLAEWAWHLPSSTKLSPLRDQGKLVLRGVLEKHVPQKLFDRPKQGFGMPLGSWMRGPLRPWVEQAIEPKALRKVGMLREDTIQKMWTEHLAGANHASKLWTVLMFLRWHEHWCD